MPNTIALQHQQQTHRPSTNNTDITTEKHTTLALLQHEYPT